MFISEYGKEKKQIAGMKRSGHDEADVVEDAVDKGERRMRQKLHNQLNLEFGCVSIITDSSVSLLPEFCSCCWVSPLPYLIAGNITTTLQAY